MDFQRKILRNYWKQRNKRAKKKVMVPHAQVVKDNQGNHKFVSQIRVDDSNCIDWKTWKLKLALGSEELVVEKVKRGKTNVRK